ncbi:helix-turn-helix domain-containing protein [Lactobacillus hominis]|uniref:HTH cro/C1-type domain-containing protein n=1 Tax=Lactobacillus hominis DSM 23910 = CRBIP 24.179 TaxID=1423758 RepID=I7IW41_9LACO|nr:Rgg/GadR/MutR family transcriptional regulator [Lactobacillus hominis]MCT3348333.1 Rgg/GadR/MutR family transcriptional regulator [Lactobacillus hominis]CCI82533.1 Putative uncharacterized protein orf-284 [Lactobacillus hominis DSM 23910 = CRBIP 24.179]
MTIGDLLREYRVNQNKTLQEFAANIIDRSYYGKVERNIHQISAENLINLLKYNQIDAAEFIKALEPNYENYQSQIQIQRKIMEEAYYKVDKDRLKKIKLMVAESNLSEKDKEIQNLIADGFLELLNSDKPNQKIRNEIKQKIFEMPKFNSTKFMLYCNSMRFYSLADNEAIVRKIIERYQICESIVVKKSLLSLVINILVFSIEENKFENIDFYINFADNVPTTPDLFFYKSVMVFFTYFIQYKKNQDTSALQYCDAIIKNFCLVGMPEYGEELQKFKDKYK